MDVYDSNGDYVGTIYGGDDSGGPIRNSKFKSALIKRITGIVFTTFLALTLIYLMVTEIILKSGSAMDGMIAAIPISVTIVILAVLDFLMIKKLHYLLKCRKMAAIYKDKKDISQVKISFINKHLDNAVKNLIPTAIDGDGFIDMDNIFDKLIEAYKDSRPHNTSATDVVEKVIKAVLYVGCLISVILKCSGMLSEDWNDRIMALCGALFGFGFIYIIANFIFKIKKGYYPVKFALCLIIGVILGVIISPILQILFLIIPEIILGMTYDINIGMECMILGIILTYDIALLIFKKRFLKNEN